MWRVIFLGGKLTSWGQICGRRNGGQYAGSVASRSVHFGHWLLDPVFGPDGIWLGGDSGEAGDDSRKRKKPVILSVSDKLHSIQKYKTCDLTEVHTLVTELDPSDPTFGWVSALWFEVGLGQIIRNM